MSCLSYYGAIASTFALPIFAVEWFHFFSRQKTLFFFFARRVQTLFLLTLRGRQRQCCFQPCRFCLDCPVRFLIFQEVPGLLASINFSRGAHKITYNPFSFLWFSFN